MRFCPWLQALCGRWRRRPPPPKETVTIMPTPRLPPIELRSFTPAELKEINRLSRAQPGQTMVARDGTEYVVQPNGSWKRSRHAVR